VIGDEVSEADGAARIIGATIALRGEMFDCNERIQDMLVDILGCVIGQSYAPYLSNEHGESRLSRVKRLLLQ
jgi:hypothetical protein